MQKRNFVLRTIQNGQVKISGMIFKPDTRWCKYDGRLDGQRWAFGLYWTANRVEPFVCLWGTEEEYYAAGDEQEWSAYCEAHDQPPLEAVYSEELENWYFPWYFWYAGDWVRLRELIKEKKNG